ncbi:MAG: 3D domain-containing protein [Salegentibacter sp.]
MQKKGVRSGTTLNSVKMILMKLSFGLFVLVLTLMSLGVSGCDFSKKRNKEPEVEWDTLQVTASAYNSVSYQTGAGNPRITAWGDTLIPGTKAIAVSRDLIDRGLDHNTPVKIEGFDGVFLVKDKMHYRWKNKIDIYMGENVQKALRFGRKKLKIYYVISKDSLKGN